MNNMKENEMFKIYFKDNFLNKDCFRGFVFTKNKIFGYMDRELKEYYTYSPKYFCECVKNRWSKEEKKYLYVKQIYEIKYEEN